MAEGGDLADGADGLDDAVAARGGSGGVELLHNVRRVVRRPQPVRQLRPGGERREGSGVEGKGGRRKGGEKRRGGKGKEGGEGGGRVGLSVGGWGAGRNRWPLGNKPVACHGD